MTALILFTAGIAAGGLIRPMALRCEYRTNPRGIDTTLPRLSWTVDSAERGQRQSAYQIIVADSRENLILNRGNLWDTRKVLSSQSIQIEYRGTPLVSRMRCYWKVRIWDREGAVSSWSQTAEWSMGLLKPSDWLASWIYYDTRRLNRNRHLYLPPSPFLRKRFVIAGEIRRATAYVSALGLCEVWINGHRVGEDQFIPGWTNYAKRVYYLTYDVTDLLKKGPNVMGAILAGGWYAGYVGFAPQHLNNPRRRGFYGDCPALYTQLEIEDGQGNTQTVVTNGEWKAATGPILEADILMGETYDARLEMPGWNRPYFDERGWEPVSLYNPGNIQLNAYPADPVRSMETLQPVNLTVPERGVYVFDLGQNFAGRVRLKIRGKRGTCVRLRFAEMLHRNGTLMTENLRSARTTDTYYLKGGGADEIWEPRFTYHGFRYVELTGLRERPDADTLTGIVLHSALSGIGRFKSSSALVNKLYQNIVWTQRSNFFEIPTDCPQRDERLGWTGDAQIYIRSAAYIMDVAAFFTKWLVALEDDQRPSGAYPDFAPLPFLLFEPSPGWMDAGVICPYTMFRVYGDTRVIKKHYPAMKRFMAFLRRTSHGNLRTPLDNSWGDWLALGPKTSHELIATAYYAYDAKLMAEMAAAIGESGDARKYMTLFHEIKAAFRRAFVSENGRLRQETQTGYAMALDMGLLPEHLIKTAAGRLVALIEERHWHITTGFLGIKHLLPVLSALGYADVAFRLLTNTTYPSWGYSIKNGATTLWERWNSYTLENGFENAEMNSFNHYAFGSVGQWMFASMAGIDTDGAGYKRIIIRPRPGGSGITATRATYHSIRGPISTDWRLENGCFILNVAIPANTTATVFIPTDDPGGITESGKPAGDSQGVRFIRTEGSSAILTIDSGNYRFKSRFVNASG